MLSMRSQKQWPDDPHAHLVDFFGQYRDPLWDKMDEFKQEIEDIKAMLPDLQQKVTDL